MQVDSPQPYLQMRHVSKTFGHVRALRDVDFDIRLGEIHSLMGENGAGKSTLMKILSGAYVPDAGSEILIEGERIEISDPAVGKSAGIAIIYQELVLAPNLTVAENVYLGREPRRSFVIDKAAMNAGVRPILNRLGATFSASDRVGNLSIAEQQMVEVAKAIHSNSRILVMDEPTTALSERETGRLFSLIRQLRSEGLAIVYISHRMSEVYELSDRVTVLRDGAYVGTLDREQIDAATVVGMMVGRDISTFYKKDHDAAATHGPVSLSVRDVGDGKRVHGCSFDAHEGEVLGIAGLVGSGRTELARLIYGADEKIAGSVSLTGRQLNIRHPSDAIDAGIVYLTEDRKQLGLFLDMSVLENVNIAVFAEDAHALGVLDRRTAKTRSKDAVSRVGIRTPSISATVGGLSGGNQQKALLSRLLQRSPRVLILDEPTRGIDVGAKSEIYRIIDDLAAAKVTIIVISSELPEIVGICDRVLVMREGRIAGEVGGKAGRPAVTQENIMAIATAV